MATVEKTASFKELTALSDSERTNNSPLNAREYRDLDLFFTKKSVNKDVNILTNIGAVKRSVRNLILLNFYEKPFHPEIGCGIRQLLFEPFTPVTSIFIRRKVEEVITNYEPRARLDQVIVTESMDRNAIEVRVVFYCMNIANPVTVLTTLQRIR